MKIKRILSGYSAVIFLVAGLILGTIAKKSFSYFFINNILSGVGLFLFMLLLFIETSKFDFRLQRHIPALQSAIIIFILQLLFGAAAIVFLFETESFAAAAAFALLFSTVSINAARKQHILHMESLLNPLAVAAAFIILHAVMAFAPLSTFYEKTFIVFQQTIIGIGAGIIVGILVLSFLKGQKANILSRLGLLASALFSYIIAETLSGNGFLAITTMALLFANSFVRESSEIGNFSGIIPFAGAIAYIALGIMAVHFVEFQIASIWMGLALFAVIAFVRFLGLGLSARTFSLREKISLSLVAEKNSLFAAALVLLSSFAVDVTLIVQSGILLLVYGFVSTKIAEKYL